MSCLRVRARLYAKAVKMGLWDGGEGWLRYAIQWRGRGGVRPAVPSSYLSRFAGISMGGRRPSNFLSWISNEREFAPLSSHQHGGRRGGWTGGGGQRRGGRGDFWEVGKGGRGWRKEWEGIGRATAIGGGKTRKIAGYPSITTLLPRTRAIFRYLSLPFSRCERAFFTFLSSDFSFFLFPSVKRVLPSAWTRMRAGVGATTSRSFRFENTRTSLFPDNSMFSYHTSLSLSPSTYTVGIRKINKIKIDRDIRQIR